MIVRASSLRMCFSVCLAACDVFVPRLGYLCGKAVAIFSSSVCDKRGPSPQRSLLAAATIALAAFAPSASAQMDSPAPDTLRFSQASGESRSSEVAESKYRYEFGSGDRIKVRIFERDDLSGEYRVRPNGKIVMPVIGSVLAAGKDQSQLEQEISEVLERVTAGQATVLTDIVEWRPFYVAGYVTKPGAYAFIPGMTVLHAMAIAGGAFRPNVAEFGGVSVTRETGRLQSGVDDLKRLLARMARIEAERDGRPIAEPSPRLVELAGPEKANIFIEDEKRILDQNNDTHERQLAGLTDTRKFAERELETQKAALDQYDLQIKDNKVVLTDLQSLLERRLTRRTRVVEVSNMINGLESQRRNAFVTVERARKVLHDTDREIALLDLRRKSGIETQILDVQKQIDAAEQALNSSKAVIKAITSAPVNVQGIDADPELTYFLLRESDKGKQFVAADETTLMLPGDVLRVGTKAAPSQR